MAVPTVPAALDAIAATIPSRIGQVAAAVQALIDPVALAVKAHGVVPVPECGLAIGAQIEAMVDAVALSGQARLDAIAMSVEPAIDAIAEVPGAGRRHGAQRAHAQYAISTRLRNAWFMGFLRWARSGLAEGETPRIRPG